MKYLCRNQYPIVSITALLRFRCPFPPPLQYNNGSLNAIAKVLELKTENNTEQPINWIHRCCVGGWRGPWSVWVDDYWSMSTINTQSLWISVVVFLFFFNVVLIWLRLLLDDFKSKYWFPRLYYYIHPHRLKADLDPSVLLAKRWWESGDFGRHHVQISLEIMIGNCGPIPFFYFHLPSEVAFSDLCLLTCPR